MFEALKEQVVAGETIAFTVRVHPGAACTKVKAVLADGTLKIDIAAPPEDGKANEELIRFLSGEFDVPKSHVEILKGQMVKAKVVRIRAA